MLRYYRIKTLAIARREDGKRASGRGAVSGAVSMDRRVAGFDVHIGINKLNARRAGWRLRVVRPAGRLFQERYIREINGT